MREYYVYILASRSRTLYTGMTGNLHRRVAEHRSNGGSFTSKYSVHRLVFAEATPDARSAIAREKQIKGWSRAKKIELINSLNPTWKDLAEGWLTAGPS